MLNYDLLLWRDRESEKRELTSGYDEWFHHGILRSDVIEKHQTVILWIHNEVFFYSPSISLKIKHHFMSPLPTTFPEVLNCVVGGWRWSRIEKRKMTGVVCLCRDAICTTVTQAVVQTAPDNIVLLRQRTRFKEKKRPGEGRKSSNLRDF